MIKLNPLVSIIVNCHNGEKYLKDCIKSILNQSYKNFEIIFFNNFSNDNSIKIINKFKDKRIKVFNSKTLLSLPFARNKAIRKSKGEYIAILDTDDLSMKNRIQKQVSFMNKNQEYGLISANCNFINSNGSLIKKTKIPSDFNSIMKKIYWSYPFNNPLLFFRRKQLAQVGNYPTKYKFINDYVLVHKISNISKVGNLPEVLGCYRVHNDSLTYRYSIKMEIEHFKFLVKLFFKKNNKTKYLTFFYTFKCAVRLNFKLLKLYN